MMRADQYLVFSRKAESRQKAKGMIEGGAVYIGGEKVSKCSENVDETLMPEVEIRGETLKYVSRGGLKLEGAMMAFGLSFEGVTAADIGSSTGGFTDCLLQNGAAKVYAVDSGTNQLHPKLRGDPRVCVMENFNARNLTEEDLGGKVDLCVCDLSFISQTKVYDAIESVLRPGGLFVSLIKPQFEAGREHLNKHGIVKDVRVHQKVKENIVAEALAHRLRCLGITDSPITGGDGNHEYLALFRREEETE